MEEVDKFYNYAYLDKSKPGFYSYPDINISFSYEPFYIGKGKKSRFLLSAHKNSGKFLTCKIKNLKDNVEIVKIYDKISESQALDNEIKLIKAIGQRIKNTGPLVNIAEGGYGSTGFRHSEEFKKRLSIINSKKQTKEHIINNTLTKFKKVAQIDLSTKETIKTFNSIKEAMAETGINHISAVCRGERNKSGGYFWKFI